MGDDFHGYKLLTEWKNRGGSYVAEAEKDGRRWFLKRYRIVVMPADDGTLDAKTVAECREKFKAFKAARMRLNKELRSVAPPGGNVVVPREEFVEDCEYCEATEFIADAVPDKELDDVLRSMTAEAKLLVMKTAADVLASVHSVHVVHSDLKPGNLLLVKKPGGQYVAKLIDFDSSYLTDDKPRGVGGTPNYFAPEQGTYAKAEDDKTRRKALAATLSEKTDVFSLGLIFHYYLAGAMPTPVNLPPELQSRLDRGKVVHAWSALVSGGSLVLSPAIKDPGLASLIGDMLALDPAKRPDAAAVLKRLSARRPVTGYCDAWPEHDVVFDTDRLRSKKVIGIAREILGGEKGYRLFYENGKDKPATLFTLQILRYIRAGHANPAPPAPPLPSPSDGFTVRPEDGIVFDAAAMRKRGFKGAAPAEQDGVRGYVFTELDDGVRFVPVGTVRLWLSRRA